MARIAIVSQDSEESRPARIFLGRAKKAGHDAIYYLGSAEYSDFRESDVVLVEVQNGNFRDDHGIWVLLVRTRDAGDQFRVIDPALSRGEMATAAMAALDELLPREQEGDHVGFV
jgi:hypothetical protein